MGLLNTPIEESTRFIDYGIKLQEAVEANFPAHRVLVFVISDQWKEFADDDSIIQISLRNYHPSIFPLKGKYNDNFLADVSALFSLPDSDITVFKHAERVDESPNAAQWEYLHRLCAVARR